MSKTNFKVQELGNNKFRITLEVPLADKWYDDVYFVCFNQKDTFTYKVGYKNKDDKNEEDDNESDDDRGDDSDNLL